MLGAAGGIEAIFSVKALMEQVLPPTINLDNQDPDCTLDYVPNVARKVENLQYALSNSFGFGGTNGSICWQNGRISIFLPIFYKIFDKFSNHT